MERKDVQELVQSINRLTEEVRKMVRMLEGVFKTPMYGGTGGGLADVVEKKKG